VTEDDELAAVQRSLEAAGISARDFDRFVNRPAVGVLEPELFDADAAFPVLLAWLPRLEHGRTRDIVARRLAQGALSVARKRQVAPALAAALREEGDSGAGWALGDALSRVLVPEVYDDVLELVADSRLGTSRQMLVAALWRVKDERALRFAEELTEDEDVRLHAESAVRRMRS
jgi:hypothetical protein